MSQVLDYGESHPSCLEMQPPSPNSSSDDVARREEILQAHRKFQVAALVTPLAETSASSSSSGSMSAAFPADDPAPESIVGGQDPFEAYLELGDTVFDETILNWFKFTSSR